MLEPLLSTLESKHIILASASPRRRELLNMLGFRYKAVSSTFEENLDKDSFPQPVDYAIQTATLKAQEVAKILQQQSETVDLVIGADTIVVQDGTIIEKPRDASDAARILRQLNGKRHSVQTGVAFVYPWQGDLKTVSFYETTEVFMAPMTEEIIRCYIETGEPMDKAGAYGIQGKGGSLVEKIVGDYYNVMGFPLHRFCKELARLYCDDGDVRR